MAEVGRQQIFQIHIHNVQEGDTTNVRIEKKTETNITNSTIEQVNIQQAEDINEAAEDPVVDEEEDEIIQGAGVLSLYSQSSISKSSSKEVSSSEDQAGASNVMAGKVEERDEIKQRVEQTDLSSQVPAKTRVIKSDSTSLDQEKKMSAQKKTAETQNHAGQSNSIRQSLLTGQAIALCDQLQFLEASSCLEQLTSIQGEKDLTIVLLQTECNLQLGREKKVDKNIDDVRTLLMASPSDVDDVIKFACALIGGKSYVRAVVLLRIASEIYKLDKSLSPDDVVKRIHKCVSKMYEATEPMIKAEGRLKVIALDYFLAFMVEMLDFLRAVENADPAIKARLEARCFHLIASNYYWTREDEKCIEFFKSGVHTMERQLRKNASKYKIYSILLNDLGFSNYNLGRYGKAEKYYMKSLDAKINASDYINEDEKQKDVEITQKNLKSTRAKMK